jgi:hypothetical protein
MSAPGPHALIFVVRSCERFTKEEYEAYIQLKNLFHAKLVRYLIILFTQADILKKNSTTLDAVLYKAGNISRLLEDAQQKYELIGNDTRAEYGPSDQDDDVLKLIQRVENAIEDRGTDKYFSDSNMEYVIELRQERIEKVLKENPGMPRKDAWAKVEREIENEKTLGTILGAAGGGIGAGLVGGLAATQAIAAGATLPFLLNPMTAAAGTGVVGAAVVGVAARAAINAAHEGRCSVM